MALCLIDCLIQMSKNVFVFVPIDLLCLPTQLSHSALLMVLINCESTFLSYGNICGRMIGEVHDCRGVSMLMVE